MKKVLSSVILIIVISFSFAFGALAKGNQNVGKAQTLMALGLFRGSNLGFELDRVPTRAEGAVMLVRLLGMEQFAIDNDFSHPFTDVPHWAKPHIAYMYEKGLTKGTGNNLYSPDLPMPAIHYVTFLLRALGYDDNEGDFNYTGAVEKALEIGLITQSQYDSIEFESFDRDKMVLISYNSLYSIIKDTGITLIEKLIEHDNAVSEEIAYLTGLYRPEDKAIDLSIKEPKVYPVKNENEFVEVLSKAILGLIEEIEIDISLIDLELLERFEFFMAQAEIAVREYTGINNLVKSWEYHGNNNVLSVKNYFYYNKDQLLQIRSKSEEIIAQIISDGMSEYEKVLAVHDYVINNTIYDYQNYQLGTIPEESYTIFGTLITGEAVCQGYAETTHLLLHMAGVDNMVVTGNAKSFTFWLPHAWNLALIEGNYYHLDTTFDDPQLHSGRQTLRYDYLNLRDIDMERDHSWDRDIYPQCDSIEYNYYKINDMVVNNKEEFIDRLYSSIEKKEVELIVRVMDYNPDDYMDISKMIFDTGKVESFAQSTNEYIGVLKISRIKYI